MTDAAQRPAAGEGRLRFALEGITLNRTRSILLVALATSGIWGAILHLACALFAVSMSPILIMSILAGIFLLLVAGLSLVVGRPPVGDNSPRMRLLWERPLK
jgi:hypothetical protein